MWLKQFPRNCTLPVNSEPTPKFVAPLKPSLEKYPKFNYDGQNRGGLQPALDATTAINYFNINSSKNNALRIKLQAQSVKISAVSTISSNTRIGGQHSQSSLEQDDDSDEENNGKNIENILADRFDFLIRLFINLGFIICLVPFQLVPVRIDHKVYFEARHHTLQRVISMTQCFNACVVSFFVALAQIWGQNIENNPLVIFKFWSYAVFCCWCLHFTNLFWRKEHLILAIVNKEPSRLSENVNEGNASFPQNLDEWIAAMYFYGVVLEEIYHKTIFYLFPKVYGLQSAAELYSGKAMYSLFLRNSSKPIPWEEISPVTLSIAIWHFVGWQSFGAIKSLFYIFVAFSSLFLIGRINKELGAVRKVATLANAGHYNGWSFNSKQIWSHFAEIRSTVGHINDLTGSCVLGIYLILVPFLSSKFIQRWDSDFVEYKILMVLQCVWPSIALVAASEASRLGEKFLRAVKDGSDCVMRSDKSGGTQLSSAYYVYENANLSMKGGKFFNVSYGFMGATLSVVMTYGLVILGFLHDMHAKTHKC